MRLIDADKVIERLEKIIKDNSYFVDARYIRGVQEVIKDQPTAYDIDGVIEQLKRYYGIVRSTSVDYAEGLKDAYERAIGIVKAGGTCQ